MLDNDLIITTESKYCSRIQKTTRVKKGKQDENISTSRKSTRK